MDLKMSPKQSQGGSTGLGVSLSRFFLVKKLSLSLQNESFSIWDKRRHQTLR